MKIDDLVFEGPDEDGYAYLGEIAIDSGRIVIGDPCNIEKRLPKKFINGKAIPTLYGDGLYSVFLDGPYLVIDLDPRGQYKEPKEKGPSEDGPLFELLKEREN